jgi:hypothetical protein
MLKSSMKTTKPVHLVTTETMVSIESTGVMVAMGGMGATEAMAAIMVVMEAVMGTKIAAPLTADNMDMVDMVQKLLHPTARHPLA